MGQLDPQAPGDVRAAARGALRGELPRARDPVRARSRRAVGLAPRARRAGDAGARRSRRRSVGRRLGVHALVLELGRDLRRRRDRVDRAALPRGRAAEPHGPGRHRRPAREAVRAHPASRPHVLRSAADGRARHARHERRREPERDVHVGHHRAALRPPEGRGAARHPVHARRQARAGRARGHAGPDRHLDRVPRRRAQCPSHGARPAVALERVPAGSAAGHPRRAGLPARGSGLDAFRRAPRELPEGEPAHDLPLRAVFPRDRFRGEPDPRFDLVGRWHRYLSRRDDLRRVHPVLVLRRDARLADPRTGRALQRIAERIRVVGAHFPGARHEVGRPERSDEAAAEPPHGPPALRERLVQLRRQRRGPLRRVVRDQARSHGRGRRRDGRRQVDDREPAPAFLRSDERPHHARRRRSARARSRRPAQELRARAAGGFSLRGHDRGEPRDGSRRSER